MSAIEWWAKIGQRAATGGSLPLLPCNDPYPLRGRDRLSHNDQAALRVLAAVRGVTPFELMSTLIRADFERECGVWLPSEDPSLLPAQLGAADASGHRNCLDGILS